MRGADQPDFLGAVSLEHDRSPIRATPQPIANLLTQQPRQLQQQRRARSVVIGAVEHGGRLRRAFIPTQVIVMSAQDDPLAGQGSLTRQHAEHVL